MTKRRLTIKEVADFDYGHHDPAHTSQFSIDSFDFKGRGDLKTRMVPGNYADNPMHDSSKLTEDDDDGMLDRLHAMLTAAQISDDEIAGDVRLTPDGTRKVAAKLGVAENEVELLLNSLAARIRKERNDDLTSAYESTVGTRDRFSMEDDYLGNITVRDGRTGQSKFLRGSRASDLRKNLGQGDKQAVLGAVFEAASKIRTERADKDIYRLLDGEKIVGFAMKLSNGRWCMSDKDDNRIGRTTYGSPKEVAAAWEAKAKESLKEDSAPKDQWDIPNGPVTYNFPWERDGEHGTATARYDGQGGEHSIRIVQARDSAGKRMGIDDTFRTHLEREARDFIGRE